MSLTRLFRQTVAPLCVGLALCAAAPALAQSGEDAFGIQVVRGTRMAATEARAAEAPNAANPTAYPTANPNAGIDAETILRAAAKQRLVDESGYSAGYFRGNTLGVILLPRYPSHQVWWNWTQDYLRTYAGRVY